MKLHSGKLKKKGGEKGGNKAHREGDEPKSNREES